jgi:mono/diheme cytochrome c family protein
MLDGMAAESLPHHGDMQRMPGFADKLNDEQAAALAKYLRTG